MIYHDKDGRSVRVSNLVRAESTHVVHSEAAANTPSRFYRIDNVGRNYGTWLERDLVRWQWEVLSTDEGALGHCAPNIAYGCEYIPTAFDGDTKTTVIEGDVRLEEQEQKVAESSAPSWLAISRKLVDWRNIAGSELSETTRGHVVSTIDFCFY
jgi:hypothetical protein